MKGGVSIRLGTRSQAYQQSFGEVTLAETYKKGEAIAGGLFCHKIFGVLEEYTCACRKYHAEKSESAACERCGVALLSRLELGARFGHITLAAPMVHPWFYRAVAALLGITERELEAIISEETYRVTSVVDPKKTPLSIGQLLDLTTLYERQDSYGIDSFEARTGVEAIEQLLSAIDLEAVSIEYKKHLSEPSPQAKQRRLTRELQEIEALSQLHQDPRSLLLEVLPVMPALYRQEEDLPPEEITDEETGEVTILQELSVNSLYKKVINRNKRLQRLLALNAPAIILRSEKIMLAQVIKDLFAGIQSKFSRNPQERWVDFSGHAVFAVDPSLSLSECAVPREMALTLWGPFLLRRLRDEELANSLDEARELLKRDPVALELLQEEMSERPTLLSSIPAVGALSMLALSPVLTSGRAILIHPLIAKYFSLVPEGDHVALHVILSRPAKEEAREKLGVSSRLLSPVSLSCHWSLSDEALVGLLYLTLGPLPPPPSSGGEGGRRPGEVRIEEVLYAYESGEIALHEEVQVRHQKQRHHTTVGRLLLAEIAPASIDFVRLNKPQTRETLRELFAWCAEHLSAKETEDLLAGLERLGATFATRAGASLCIEDFLLPPSKADELQKALQFSAYVEEQYYEGLITYEERYNKHVDLWARAHDSLHKETLKLLSKEKNQLWMITEATKTKLPAKLSSTLGGLVEFGGRVVEAPGLESLREGLSTIPYFFDAWRARSETLRRQGRDEKRGALQQAIAQIAREVRIDLADCQTQRGFTMRRPWHNAPLAPWLVGRVLAQDAWPFGAMQRITPEIAAHLEERHPNGVVIRSPLTCQSKRGVCLVCYGAEALKQDAVGFFAACAAPSTDSSASHEDEATIQELRVWKQGILRLSNADIATNSAGERRLLSFQARWRVMEGEDILDIGTLSYGSTVLTEDGAQVEPGQVIASWDPTKIGIYAEHDGVVSYQDLSDVLRYEIDMVSGLSSKFIGESSNIQAPTPALQITDPSTQRTSKRALPAGALLCVEDGDSLKAGDLIAQLLTKKSRVETRSSEELFELTPPQQATQLAAFDGIISFGRNIYERGEAHRSIHLTDTPDETKTYLIPRGQAILVQDGEPVIAGARLCEGEIDLHELLQVMGPQEVARFFLQNLSLQWQGPSQHIELILRQMLSYVKIVESGDSDLDEGEIVAHWQWEEEADRMVDEGKLPPIAEQILLSISALREHQRLSVASLYEANSSTIAKLATSGEHIPL